MSESQLNERAWKLVVDDETGRVHDLAEGPGTEDQQRLAAQTIQGVTDADEFESYLTMLREVYAFVRPGDAAAKTFARGLGAVWAPDPALHEPPRTPGDR